MILKLIMVTVKFTSLLRRDIGRELDTVAAESLTELIRVLEQRYGDVFTRCLDHCHIFVNGSSAAVIDVENTPLVDGDEVLFLLQVAGG